MKIKLDKLSQEQQKAIEHYKFLTGQMIVAGYNIKPFSIDDREYIREVNEFYNGLFTNVITE